MKGLYSRKKYMRGIGKLEKYNKVSKEIQKEN